MATTNTSNENSICPNTAAVAKSLRKNLEIAINGGCGAEEFAVMFENCKSHLAKLQQEETVFLQAKAESRKLGDYGREVLFNMANERHEKQMKDLEGYALFVVMKLKQDKDFQKSNANGAGRKQRGGRKHQGRYQHQY